MYGIKHLEINEIIWRTYWRCMKVSSLKFQFSSVQYNNSVEKNPHNHLPDTEEINVTKCLRKIKD